MTAQLTHYIRRKIPESKFHLDSGLMLIHAKMSVEQIAQPVYKKRKKRVF